VKPFAFATMQHKVQRLRKELGLPSYFTFDACRHGGMTELEGHAVLDQQFPISRANGSQRRSEGLQAGTTQCRSNSVSGSSLRKTGISAGTAGEFPQVRRWDQRTGSPET